jgi:hypothetical protein
MALFMVACDRTSDVTAPGRASGNPSQQAIVSRTNEQDVPWADVEQNPCTGDMVTIQGTTHFIFNTSFDGNTGYHLNTQSKSKGTGTGAPSLYTYKVSEDFMYHENNPEGPQFEQTQVEHLLILGPKSVDNYIKHMEFKMVGNGNGEIVVSRDRTWTKCVG